MSARRIALLALALAGLLAAACATLRVDVDVYTGPLADHEDIQAERMAVMAMGAKPLLIDLRDRLENARRKTEWDKLEQDRKDAILTAGNRHFGPSMEGYEPGFMAAGNEQQARNWIAITDHKAQRVNGVLGLYEDAIDRELAPYFRDGQRQYEQYCASQESLGSPDALEWTATLGAISGDKAVLSLARAYQNFFATPPFVYSVMENATAEYRSRNQGLLKTPGKLERSTAFFTHLAQDQNHLVTTHAALLFPKDETTRAGFAKAVRSRADAFLAKREALEGLYTVSLRFIRDIHQEPLQSLVGDKQKKLTEIAVSVATSLLKAGYLAGVKKDLAARQGMEKVFDAADGFAMNQWPAIKDRVKLALLADPRPMAEQLLLAHEAVKQGQCPSINDSPEETRFGTTLFADDELPSMQALQDHLDILLHQVATSGLEKGRGPWGLETVIEEYLAAAETYCLGRCKECTTVPPAEENPACLRLKARLDAARDRLHEEVARFGVKVQGTASFDVLLAPETGDGSAPDAENPIPAGSGIEENIQVLQAVANSVISQANELRFREEHREALAKHLPGMVIALGQTYLPTDGRTMARIEAQLGTERDAAETRLAAIGEELKARPDDQGLKDEKARKTALSESLKTAIATVGKVRSAWGEETKDSPPEVMARLRDKLAALDDKAAAKTTQGILDARTFDFAVMGELTPKAEEHQDPRLALDQLLDTLRLLLAQQVEAGGAQAPAAVRTREAISVVEAQRAGLVYIRPASAFLRSSYPATAVAPGYEPGWKNTLARNFLRSIPIFGELRSPSEKRRLKMFAEIDRQSWQNVNTVRLEGAGNTNYAIAKDDIGNWYAKAYSADPGPIIKAAKGLAMYTLGIGSGGAAQALAAGAGNATDGQQKTSLESLREKYAARYEAQGKAQAETLIAWLKAQDGNTAAVKKAWTAAGINDFDDVLTAVKGREDLPVLGDTLKNNEQKHGHGARILAGLKAVKRYAVALNEALLVRAAQAQQQSQDTAEITRARNIARDVLRKELATRLAQRQATVGEYATAVRFIEEAATGETTAAQ